MSQLPIPDLIETSSPEHVRPAASSSDRLNLFSPPSTELNSPKELKNEVKVVARGM